MRLFELILEMTRDDEKWRNEALKELPDDDLEALVKSQIVETIQSEPQLAIDAVKQLGWTLVPADTRA